MSKDHGVAIVHWDLPADGGGERVVWELARTYDAPVYTATRNPAITPEDITVHSLLEDRSLLHRATDSNVPGVRQLALVYGWLSSHQLGDYDTVITSGNEPLFYTPRDGQTWVHYAHHTGRLATDRLHKLSDWHTGLRGTLTKPLDYALKYAQRTTSRLEAHTPDHVVCNSDIIKDRLCTYWGLPSDRITVVYPPIRTEETDPELAETQDYYLTVGRVEPAKGIHLMLDAVADTDIELKVAGTGSAQDRLRARAPANVEFLGYIPEREKWRRLSEARAFLFAAENEDFGMAPVEALAAGTPVIGVDEGFTQYQVFDGGNGVLAERSAASLQDAIKRVEREGVAWTPQEIAMHAERYSVDEFRARIRAVVDETRAEKQDRRTPDWYPVAAPPNAAKSEEPETAAADGGGDGGE